MFHIQLLKDGRINEGPRHPARLHIRGCSLAQPPQQRSDSSYAPDALAGTYLQAQSCQLCKSASKGKTCLQTCPSEAFRNFLDNASPSTASLFLCPVIPAQALALPTNVCSPETLSLQKISLIIFAFPQSEGKKERDGGKIANFVFPSPTSLSLSSPPGNCSSLSGSPVLSISSQPRRKLSLG